MLEQVQHLRAMGTKPNVELRLLPFEAGAHTSPEGSFTLLKMSAPFPEVAHVESPAGSIYLETESVDELIDAYDWLYEHGLSNEDTVAFLMSLEEDLQ